MGLRLWTLVLLLCLFTSCIPSPHVEVEENGSGNSTIFVVDTLPNISTPKKEIDCSINYLTPPNPKDIDAMLERFETELHCKEGLERISLGEDSYLLEKGEQSTLYFGIGNDVTSTRTFDISVGCYDAEEEGVQLKKIRFHSFSSYTVAQFDVTAIRMVLETKPDADEGIYQCSVYACQTNTEDYCSIPKPPDWPATSGIGLSVPAYKPYGKAEFTVVVQ